MMRLNPRGVEVPACIRRESDHHGQTLLIARIRGVIAETDDIWLRRGREIDEAEYEYQMATCAWEDQHNPDGPIANPLRPIDLAKLPAIF